MRFRSVYYSVKRLKAKNEILRQDTNLSDGRRENLLFQMVEKEGRKNKIIIKEGVQKMKIKIMISTVDRKAKIKSFKKQAVESLF